MSTDDDEPKEPLSYRIEKAREKPQKSDPPPDARNVGIDFIGTVVVCGIVGALADRAFKSAPWCMLAAIVLGFAVGLAIVWQGLNKTKK